MFRMNEGNLVLPAGWNDRSVNIFTVGSGAPLDLSVIVSRDTLPDGQDFAAFVDGQIAKLPGQLKSFRLIGKRQRQFAVGPVLEAEFTWKADNGPMHQRQVYLERAGKILIFTASAPVKIADEHEAQFNEMLDSFNFNLD